MVVSDNRPRTYMIYERRNQNDEIDDVASMPVRKACSSHLHPTNTPATTENSRIVFVRKPDFDRAFGAIINARMQDIIDEFGINRTK